MISIKGPLLPKYYPSPRPFLVNGKLAWEEVDTKTGKPIKSKPTKRSK